MNSTPRAGRPMETLGFLSVDGGKRGLEMLQQYSQGLTYIALFHYPLNSKGEITGTPDKGIVDLAHSKGLKVLLVLSNFIGPQFNPYVMRNIMIHRDIQTTLTRNLINLLERYDLDGVNLDLENMFPQDRQLFSAFVARLAGELKARNKFVTIDVPAKTKDEPQAQWRGAFDYRAVGKAVDRVVLMTYEEHWADSEPGPVASLPWVKGVVDYAASLIEPEKIYLGLPLYGYDWPLDLGKGKTVTYTQAMRLAASHGAKIQWDSVMEAPHFTYIEKGAMHRVWFENVRSAAAKINLAQNSGLKGLGIWEMKLSFPEFWRYIIDNVPVVRD